MDNIYTMSKDYYVIEVDGDYMVLPETSAGIANASIFAVNAIGAELLNLLKEPATLESLIRHITTMYTLPENGEEMIKKILHLFYTGYLKKELLQMGFAISDCVEEKCSRLGRSITEN